MVNEAVDPIHPQKHFTLDYQPDPIDMQGFSQKNQWLLHILKSPSHPSISK